MREHAEADPVGSEQVPEAAIGQTLEGSFSAVSKSNFASGDWCQFTPNDVKIYQEENIEENQTRKDSKNDWTWK